LLTQPTASRFPFFLPIHIIAPLTQENLTMTSVSEALQLAMQHHRANHYSKAQRVYSKILESQPNQPDALYGLGILFQQIGQPETAAKLLNTALKVQPNSARIWFGLGNLHQTNQDFEAAIKAYQQALKFDPNSIAIRNNLGYTLQQQGQLEAAIDCYKTLLKIHPNCIEAEVNLANIYFAQNQLSEEQITTYARLNNQLGQTRQKEGNFAAAIAYYQQAIQMQPQFVNAHHNLGSVLQLKGQLHEAITAYETALDINPDDGEAYYQLGKIYQKQNHLEAAAIAYQTGLSLINPYYAITIESAPQKTESERDYTTPFLPTGTVTVGGHPFPAISPVYTPKKRPFWSVVIPVYNRKQFILECLASVLIQWRGHEEMEIIVMDNASDPPIADLVHSIGRGIVRYYRHPENLPLQHNWNAAVSLCQGYWIHLLHDDDYVLPGFYARLKQSLENAPDSVGGACTGYENFNEQETIIFSQDYGYGDQRGIAKDWLWKIGVSNPMSPPSVVIRRAAYERLGGYNPEFTYTTDWELYKRVASFYDWWYEPGFWVRYRQHSQNVTTEQNKAGIQGKSVRLAIELSERYFPIEHCAEITAKARSHYFDWCLLHLSIPLKAGNVTGAFRLLQEALRIDSSPAALDKLFAWLRQPEATPLRNEVVSQLISVSLAENTEKLYFAQA
jgi:tetratricopeptide (TPR) repeat protein/glycosyltransferase involved in cell wall biosynthesis